MATFLRKNLNDRGLFEVCSKILKGTLTRSWHAFNTYFWDAKFLIRLSSCGMRTTVRTDLAIYIESMSASFGLYWFLSINWDHARHLVVIKPIFLSEYFSLGLASQLWQRMLEIAQFSNAFIVRRVQRQSVHFLKFQDKFLLYTLEGIHTRKLNRYINFLGKRNIQDHHKTNSNKLNTLCVRFFSTLEVNCKMYSSNVPMYNYSNAQYVNFKINSLS
jgi:hypothetical protein